MIHKYLKNVVTLSYNQGKCTGCGMCVEVCPHGVFQMNGTEALLKNIDLCMECGACKTNCAYDAIDVRSGVGCAGGIVAGFLKGGEASCDCGGGECC